MNARKLPPALLFVCVILGGSLQLYAAAQLIMTAAAPTALFLFGACRCKQAPCRCGLP